MKEQLKSFEALLEERRKLIAELEQFIQETKAIVAERNQNKN